MPHIHMWPSRAATSVEALTRLGRRTLCADVTTEDVAEYDLAVVRVLVTGLQPMHFGHGEACLGGKPLFELPWRMNLAAGPRTGRDLNPCPHPLAWGGTLTPIDDPTALSLLYHLNSEPWLNTPAYASPYWVEYQSSRSAEAAIPLPAREDSALGKLIHDRHSCRRLQKCEMPLGMVSTLLWAANGLTRQARLPDGAYLPRQISLQLDGRSESSIRRVASPRRMAAGQLCTAEAGLGEANIEPV